MDKYLIDIQILLWHSENPDKISKAANNIINSDVELYISIASFWEIAIKVKTGKLELPFTSFTEFYNFSVLKARLL